MLRPVLPSLAFCVSLSLLAGPVWSADGRVEINQTCAVETGCLPGDPPGFPVVLDASGSYILTSNLVLPTASTTGISVAVSDISIDLNSFSIVRADCEGSTTNCTPPDTPGFGIIGFAPSGVSVRNGSITGMGRGGILLGDQAEVVGVQARWNGNTGIGVGAGATVRESRAFQNGGQGILTTSGSSVIGSTAFGNGDNGIDVNSGSTVTNNSSVSNGGVGIQALLGSTVSNNTSFANGEQGILCLERCVVRANTVRSAGGVGIQVGVQSVVRDNSVSLSAAEGIIASTSSTVIGNSSNSNGGDGIQTGNASTVVDNSADSNVSGDGLDVGDGSNVRGNTARSNDEFGLRAESTLVGFGDNVFGNNNGGPGANQTSSGTNLGGNLCDTSLTCP